MRKLFFIVISIFLITSCSKQEVILDSKIEEKINIINEKIFVVIPHHNLVNEEIDDYYKSLKDKY
jgi:uncharacterized protein YcfL